MIYAVTTGKSWWGSKDLLLKVFESVAVGRLGLIPTSRKRAAVLSVDGLVSDHSFTALRAYAVDYGFPAGWSQARKLGAAATLANLLPPTPVWKQDTTQDFFGSNEQGKRFRIQLLYGAAIGHADHIHVGVKRVFS